ncbi:hypothetical protein D3C87_201060 [compost metagenome]
MVNPFFREKEQTKVFVEYRTGFIEQRLKVDESRISFFLYFQGKKMKITLTTSILFLCLFAFGQVKIETTVEAGEKDNEIIRQLYPIGKQGLLTFSGLRNSKDRYRINWYSTTLEKRNSLEFETKLPYFKFIVNEDSSEFTFIHDYKTEWYLKTLNVNTGLFTEKVLKKTGNFGAIRLNRMKNKIVMTASDQENRIIILDMETGEQKSFTIPGASSSIEISSISIDHTTESALILFHEKKKKTISVITLNKDGMFSKACVLNEKPGFQYLCGRVTRLSATGFLLTGTYGDAKKDKAVGFYSSKWENNEQQFVTYHSFSEINQFAGFLTTHEEYRNLKKGTTIPSESMVDYHGAYVTKDGFQLVAESYCYTYRFEKTGYYGKDVNGKSGGTSSVKVSDGSNYTHMAVLDVDWNGQKLNDYCLPMTLDYKPEHHRQIIQVLNDPQGNTKVVYPGSNKMTQVRITGGKAEMKQIGEFGTNFYAEGRAPKTVRCFHWYDKVFLAYSMEEVLLEGAESKDYYSYKPAVYLFNRVTCEE